MLTFFLVVGAVAAVFVAGVRAVYRQDRQRFEKIAAMNSRHHAQLQEVQKNIDRASMRLREYIMSRDENDWPSDALTHFYNLRAQEEKCCRQRDRIEQEQASERAHFYSS